MGRAKDRESKNEEDGRKATMLCQTWAKEGGWVNGDFQRGKANEKGFRRECWTCGEQGHSANQRADHHR